MPKPGQNKYDAQFGFRIDGEEAEKFTAYAEACKSTKDIVLRELVYAFNRYCAAQDGRFPVLQYLEVIAPGYVINESGWVEDASGPARPVETKPYPKPSKSRAARPPRKEERPGAA